MTKGQRIRELRECVGKSQVELADLIGVSKQTLYKYENDIITNIPSDKIEAIASVTNSTPAFIMGWEDPAAGTTAAHRGLSFVFFSNSRCSKPIIRPPLQRRFAACLTI